MNFFAFFNGQLRGAFFVGFNFFSCKGLKRATFGTQAAGSAPIG
jgi:hypothetical protein